MKNLVRIDRSVGNSTLIKLKLAYLSKSKPALTGNSTLDSGFIHV